METIPPIATEFRLNASMRPMTKISNGYLRGTTIAALFALLWFTNQSQGAMADSIAGMLSQKTSAEQAAPVSGSLSSADSAEKSIIRDSLITEKTNHILLYQVFPVSLDSTHNPRYVRRNEIFSSNAISVSDIAQRRPQMIAAPFSLSNSLNRSLPYGFPLPAGIITTSGELLGDKIRWCDGSDMIGATHVSELEFGPSGNLNVTPYSDNLTVPETDFLWENGLFYESLLNVRFTRPLSRNLNFSLTSNNRFFKSINYSTAGDIKSLFEGFVKDTNLLAQGGHNPLVAEQNSQLRFSSTGKNGERRYVSVGYDDDQNEISHGGKDSTKDSLLWDRIFRFGTNATAGINGLRLNPALLDVELKLISEGHTKHALSTGLERLGRDNEYALALKPSIPFHDDTASCTVILTRHEQTLYDNSKRTAHEGNAAIAYAHHFYFLGMNGALSGGVGQHFLKIKNTATENEWTGNLSALIESPHRMLRLFALRDCAPYPLLFDTVKIPLGSFSTFYESYGAEAYVTWKKVGLMTGVCGFSGLDAADSTQVWPENILPYRQPHVAWVIAPVFGAWHGFSVCSRWMLSDAGPRLKARNSLSYQAHPLGGREHILVDGGFDYWSARDTLTYGGVTDWNREVLNVWLQTSVQIKTFSLFYKVDNILNRKYAYIPGYRMPGLTFRWGFQWLIQG